MNEIKFRHRLPGIIANVLAILVTAFWTYWGFGEMYHEGWWGAWYNRLPYLAICTVLLGFTLVAIKWPRVGGWILVLIGAGFSLWWWGDDLIKGHLTLQRFLGVFPLSGSLVIIGALFWAEARLRKRLPPPQSPRSWIRRNLWSVIVVGAYALIAIGFSAAMLPIVLTRVDDGDRGARRIEGNGSTLVWAPEGPGWNWKQPWGGYPSWHAVALYGMEPIGFDEKPGYERLPGERRDRFATAEDMAQYNVCRYLNADGLTLSDTPQDVWRIPGVDDYARAFARHGENAGCAWQGEFMKRVPCEKTPDKETPLWNPTLAPIYYWAVEEYNEREAYFVSYNGFINAAYKSGGNPRHSYRCVREP